MNSERTSIQLNPVLIITSLLFLLISSSSNAIPIVIYEINDNDLVDKFSQSIGSASEVNSLNRRLLSELSSGDYDTVLKTIEQTFKSELVTADIRSIKIAALIGQKKFAEAGRELLHLSQQNDLSQNYIQLIGNMYSSAGKPIEALRAYQLGLVNHHSSSDLLFNIGRAYDKINHPASALVYFNKAAELNKTSPLVPEHVLQQYIASSYLKLNQYAQAVNALPNHNTQDQSSLIKGIANAKYYASNADYTKSLATLNEIDSRNNSPAVSIVKAQVYNMMGKPERALELLVDKNRLDNYPKTSVELVNSLSYLQSDSPGKALSSLNKVSNSSDKPANFNLILAITHIASGNKEAAHKALQFAQNPFPELSVQESIIKHLGPPAIGPDLGLAFFCLDQGYFTQVVDITTKSLKEYKDNVFLHFLLAEAYRRLDKDQLAIAQYKKLTQIMPESFSLRYLLANAYDNADMDQEALNIYESLSKDRPDFILAQLAYGSLLQRHEQWSKARNVYQWSLNFKPDSKPLLTALAWNLLSLKDLDSASSVINTLKQKNINTATIMHLNGWAAYQAGNYQKSISLLSRAMLEAPGNPEIYYHLAQAYQAIGENRKSANILTHAYLFPEIRERYKNATS